jgi:hypothetical protein
MRVFSVLVLIVVYFFSIPESRAELIAHWPLDEKSGSTVTDVVGGKDGTLFNFDGNHWRSGKAGGALYFNGYSSYVSHGFNLPRDRGTLMHWVKSESFGKSIIYYESDFGNPDHGATDYNGFNSGGEALEIHTGWDGRDSEFCFYYQDGGEAVNECDRDYIVDDGWNHVAVTWDVEGELILYLNCQRSGSEDFPAGIFRNFQTTQGYFGRPSDQERFFNGLLDDIRVYNTVMTPEDAEFRQRCEQVEFHSSIMAQEVSIPSTDFAGHLCTALAEHGMHNIWDVVLLMQTPFGGGFVDAMQTVFGNNIECSEWIPWLAASASDTVEPSRGWSDMEVDMNTVHMLGSTWTQAIAGPAGPTGGAPGVIFNGSETQDVLQDLLTAREIDIAGPSGKNKENPRVAIGGESGEVRWSDPGIKHEALLINAGGHDLRNVNDLLNMRTALDRLWQGGEYNITSFNTFDPVTEDVLDAITLAVQRLDANTQLLIYVTGHGDSTADLSSLGCGLATQLIQGDMSCCFDLPASWYEGVFGDYEPGAWSPLTFGLDVETCDGCTSWQYTFNNRAAQFGNAGFPGLGTLSTDSWNLRPGRNCLEISTGGFGSMRLSGARLTTGPLNILDVNHRLKPGQTGAFYDADRSGEGIFVELLEDDRVVVYVFTFTPDETGRQAWMLGVGEMIGNHIVVTEMYRPTGPRFGPDFNPNDRVLNPFGGLALTMPECGDSQSRGTLFMSPPVDSEYELMASTRYVQLTGIVDCNQLNGHDKAGFSGSWYDKSHSGEGIILEVLNDGRVLTQWFTYDNDGEQMWIQGVGELDGDILNVKTLYTATGTTWGTLFDSDDVVRQDWGSLTMEFHDCDNATAMYESTVGFGNGSFNMIRLTSLLGIPCK